MESGAVLCFGSDWPVSRYAISLDLKYAVSGTERAYGATSMVPLEGLQVR